MSPTPEDSATVQDPYPKLGRVGSVVHARACGLQHRLFSVPQDPTAVATLARLRRGVGKRPGELLDVLEFTVAEAFRPGPSAAASADENAAHVAMTLFALHQQSKRERMHRRGHGLGAALRALHQGNPNEVPEPIRRRFRILGTADSFTELTHHLRGAVQLLRAGEVPLDYGLLADQLVSWQWPDGPDRVRLRWGREFYRTERPASASPATP